MNLSTFIYGLLHLNLMAEIYLYETYGNLPQHQELNRNQKGHKLDQNLDEQAIKIVLAIHDPLQRLPERPLHITESTSYHHQT